MLNEEGGGFEMGRVLRRQMWTAAKVTGGSFPRRISRIWEIHF
jgi:hypothetical protein